MSKLCSRLHDFFEGDTFSRIESQAKQHPQWADVCNTYGLALACKSDFEASEQQFRAALKSNPRYSWAQLNLVTVLAIQGRCHEARRFLVNAGDPAEGAKLIVEAWVAVHDAKPQAADAVLHKLTPALRERPDVLLLRGLTADLRGAGEVSRDFIAQLHSHAYWSELEQSYHSAEAQNGPRVGIFPGMHYMWRRVSKMYAYDEQLDQAHAAADLAYFYWSDRGTHVTHLGMLHSLTGNFKLAAVCYEDGLKLAPRDPEPASALASYWAAHGDTDQAAAYLTEALRRAPGYPDLHRRLGVLECARGNDLAALASFERALEINPLFSAARLEMAETLSRLNRWQDAANAYQNAVDSGLQSPDILIQLGRCYEAMGASDQAVRVYTAASDTHPEDQRFKQSLSALNALGEERKAS